VLISVLKFNEQRVADGISEKLPNMKVVGEVMAALFLTGLERGGEFRRVRKSSGIAIFSI
jgi:hypothetical protein